MAELTQDLIAEILCRLPVKSLLRFRCTSKLWRSLMNRPAFIKRHLHQSTLTRSNLNLIFRSCQLLSLDFDSLDEAVDLNHPSIDPECGTQVLGSCDGLLCLSSSHEDVALWNMSTRKYQQLPFPKIDLSFDCHVYGFGHDSVTDDYKVVRIVQFYSPASEVLVFGLKPNSWRRVQDFPYYLRYRKVSGVFAGGALHWVATRKPEDSDGNENLIAAFDLGVDEFREVPMPENLEPDFHMNVTSMEGSLCLLCNYFMVHIDVWVMKDYGVPESWTKLFSVVEPEVKHVYPLTYSKNGDKVLLNQDDEKFVWYDLQTNRIENISIRGDFRYVHEVNVCPGSLVRLKSDGGRRGRKRRKEYMRREEEKKMRDDILSTGIIKHIL